MPYNMDPNIYAEIQNCPHIRKFPVYKASTGTITRLNPPPGTGTLQQNTSPFANTQPKTPNFISHQLHPLTPINRLSPDAKFRH